MHGYASAAVVNTIAEESQNNPKPLLALYVGDWLNYGERSYGETYAQALEETDYSYQGLADAKYVSGRIEISRRRENIPFSIHREVASLPPEQQDRLLQEAERDGLTVREVRRVDRRRGC